MNKTSIKQLDEVLSYIYEKNSELDINNEYKNFSTIDKVQLVAIIEHFFNDGLLIDRGNNRAKFSINYKGMMFKEAGGYAQKKIIDARIETKTNRNECLLIVGTWLAGIGALSLTAWEIYKTFVLRIC